MQDHFICIFLKDMRPRLLSLASKNFAITAGICFEVVTSTLTELNLRFWVASCEEQNIALQA